MSDYIYNPDTGELYHYGVKGMKWGHRKRPEYVESARANMRTARANKRAASKALNKSYDKAYNYSSTHMISQYTREKQKAESDRRWNDFNNKARESNKADAAYKQAKREYKQAKKQRNQAVNEQYKQFQKEASFKEKLIYNDATRKQAAKYVVDHNMSMADATAKAKGDAKRNTAIVLAAYGAITVAELYRNK